MSEISTCWQYVSQEPSSLVYHTRGWQQVIETTYRYSPRYIVAREASQVRGLLPLFEVNSLMFGRHLSAIPFSHFVPALYDNDAILKSLVNQARDVARQLGSRFVEVRGSGRDLARYGYKISSHNWLSWVDLRIGEAELCDGIHNSAWRNYRKARKNGLKVREGQARVDFDSFYRLILETRRYQGSLPYSRWFFDALQALPQTRLYLACKDDEILAGIVMLCHGDRAIYAYGASTKDQEALSLRPNDLLFGYVIIEMQAQGYSVFDFGTTPQGNEGLLRFKEKWGAQSEKLAYAYWLNTATEVPVINRSTRLARFIHTVVRSMPLWMLRIVGPHILRQLG